MRFSIISFVSIIRQSIFSAILTATLTGVAFATSFGVVSAMAQENPAIHDAMKNSIGPAFKVIATDMKAGVITAQTQLAGKTILSGFEAIQKEIPNEVPDGKGGVRPITPAEVTTFQQYSADMLALVKILVTQLNASDVAAAQKTVQQMGDLRRKSHDQFKAD